MSEPEFVNLSEVEPRQESPEHAYRRGYRDGWIAGIDTLHGLMFKEGKDRQSAYEECWQHWQFALVEWMHDIDGRFLPPDLPARWK